MQKNYRFEWNDNLLTHIPWIDSQHKRLLDKINALLNVIIEEKNYREVRETIQFLEHYVKAHFATEEKFMKHYGFPGLNAHKLEHSKFSRRIDTLVKDFGNSASMKQFAKDLAKETWDWYTNHVEHEDLEFADFLRDKRVSSDNESAAKTIEALLKKYSSQK